MKRFVVLGAAMLALMARPAYATTINVTSDTSFIVNWSNPVTDPDLSGSARFTISNLTTGGFDLLVDQIMNSTLVSPNINARLTSFGFGLSPNFLNYSNVVNGSVFSWGFTNFPNFGSVDACGYAGNNCSGGGSGGLNQGQSMAGGMSIHFDGPFSNGVTFSPIPARFQTGPEGGGSYEFEGTITTNTAEAAVPEPASLMLVGSGFVLAARRLKQARQARS